jgi:hypothetical protein
MATKYQVVDSQGQVHKRTTKDRTYTHSVVHHVKGHKKGDVVPYGDGTTYIATRDTEDRSAANWCGNAGLAEKEANVWRKHGWDVEIIAVK